MKILFIYTDIHSSVGYSAGIGILSAQLKKNGHSTKLIHVSEELDYPLDLARINRDIAEYRPGLICLSATTNQWHFVRAVGRSIKEHFDTAIMVGGHHPTADPENVIAEPWVDILCRGEGDLAICSVADRLEKGLPIDRVPNLYLKSEDGVIRNPLSSWVKDMDGLPVDDYGLFDYPNIVRQRRGWAEVIVTRGCPYRCSYCFNLPLLSEYIKQSSQAGSGFDARCFVSRRRSVDRSIELLGQLKTQYPDIRGFTFVDDVMARDGRWFEQFAVRYRDEIGLPYACTSQPLIFTERVAELLKMSGCKVVKMGIEAGNERIRRNVLKRNISDEHLVHVFDLAKRYGLKSQSFNMIGLPDETAENMMETVELNARIKPYIVWLSTFNPYPGTELYRYCKEKNLIDEAEWDHTDTYRGSSVLKTELLSSTRFIKIRVMFRWFLNRALGSEAEEVYDENIEELSSLPDEAWRDGSAEKIFSERDREIDAELRRRDVSHYISIKYINVFWGREYNYDLS